MAAQHAVTRLARALVRDMNDVGNYGGTYLVWMSSSGSNTSIYAQRMDSSGNKLWNSGNPVLLFARRVSDHFARLRIAPDQAEIAA